VSGLDDPQWKTWLDEDFFREFSEQIELVDGVYERFSAEKFLKGEQTPVFFGSAINNFGVEMLLKKFCEVAPKPQPRQALERKVEPQEPKFSGFIFKIQANMDARHRDRIAFLRICSGKFSKGMDAYHVRLKKKFKVGGTFQFLASERSQVEEAVAGDIIGLYDTGNFKIGDSLTEGENLSFLGIPNFSPELFQRVVLKTPLKSKQLHQGLQQLCEEGASQVFYPQNSNDIVVGVVGQLQFEVIQFRLENEYGASSKFETCPYRLSRWVLPRPEHKDKFQKTLDALAKSYDTILSKDAEGRWAILCSSEYALNKANERYPEVEFVRTSELVAR
jgi:peptide chain release factor 3